MTSTLIRMQQRHDTGANWDAYDPVLLPAEIGYDTDEGRFKIGDGTTAWSALDYLVGTPADLDPAVAALVSSGGAFQGALDAAFVGYYPRGLDLSGATDVSASLIAAFNAGERVHLKYGGPTQRDYLLSEQVGFAGIPGGDTIFTADEGVRLIRAHTGRGIAQMATPVVAAAPITAAAFGADHVQWTTSPGWTTDQWVGCDVQVTFTGTSGLPVYDPGTTYQQGDQVQFDSDGAGPGAALAYQSEVDSNTGNDPSPTSVYWSRLSTQTHKIIANSADTVYFTDTLGALVGAGSTGAIIRPQRNTVMTGWEMLCPAGGTGAGVVLNWPGYLDLDFEVDAPTVTGNPASIYRAEGGHSDIKARGGSILTFYYNCDRLRITGDVQGVTGLPNFHGIQVKDSRDCTVYDAKARDVTRAVDVKCSGLHAAYRNAIRGGTANNISTIAFDLYSLTNEGKGHALQSSSISDVKGISCATVARAYEANDLAGPRSQGLRIDNFTAMDSTGPALVVNARKVEARGRIIGSGPYAIALLGADYSTVVATVEQSNRTSNTEVMRVTDTVGALTQITVDVAAGDNTRKYVNEVGASTGNRHLWTPRDPSAVITTDATLLGTSLFSKLAAYDLANARVHAALDMAADRIYTMNRLSATLSNAFAMGTVHTADFTPLIDLAVSQVRMQSGSAAKVGTATLCRLGLFTVDAAGLHTLVARTQNDPSMFDAADTFYARPLGSRTLAGAAATDDTITAAAHGMAAGQKVQFSAVVAGLTTATTYYVRDVTTDTFKVAATLGGAAVDVTASGSVTVEVLTTVQLYAGQRYAIGVLMVGATSATFRGASMQQSLGLDGLSKGGRLGGAGTSTDLPTAATGLGNGAVLPLATVLV